MWCLQFVASASCTKGHKVAVQCWFVLFGYLWGGRSLGQQGKRWISVLVGTAEDWDDDNKGHFQIVIHCRVFYIEIFINRAVVYKKTCSVVSVVCQKGSICVWCWREWGAAEVQGEIPTTQNSLQPAQAISCTSEAVWRLPASDTRILILGQAHSVKQINKVLNRHRPSTGLLFCAVMQFRCTEGRMCSA